MSDKIAGFPIGVMHQYNEPNLRAFMLEHSSTWEKLLDHSRRGHFIYGPQPLQEQAEFDAWHAKLQYLLRRGVEKGWVDESELELDATRPTAPRELVFDETEQEWLDRIGARPDGTVVFPVRKVADDE